MSITTSLSRTLSHLRLLAMGVVLALPLACWQVGASVSSETSRSELAVAAALLECPVGGYGCPCTSGGGCDPGLVCMSGTCGSGDSGGDGVTIYEFEDDLDYELAMPEPAPMREISVDKASKRGGKAKFKNRGDAANFASDAPAGSATAPAESMAPAKQAPPVSVVGTESTTSEEPATSDELDDDARQIIYTAGLQVAVYELDAAIELAESLPQRYGGWIESRYDYQITLRLPAERLFEAMELLGGLGVVLSKSLRADDVTDEYLDLESRIHVLEQLVEQLELLLAKAKTVEEALKIRIELDRVRVELEAARTRMRSLSELIDFSTLTLFLSKRGPVDALPSSNDPFPWVNDLGVETTEYR
jgi:hypothetical protein